MRNVVSNQAQRNCYAAGREARSLDQDKDPARWPRCPAPQLLAGRLQ